jgi:regulator-associated protein of mTOR
MRDPTTDMEPSSQQTTNGSTASRRNPNKSVRVAFGPDLETTIPTRERSPAPLVGHHRSLTSVEQKPPTLTPPARPTSSSGENIAVREAPPRRPSPRRSGSSRPALLKRAKSDYGPSRITFDKAAGDDDEDFAMRHGWQEEYTSSEYLKILHSVSSATVLVTSQKLI